jgi:hypothetical protein
MTRLSLAAKLTRELGGRMISTSVVDAVDGSSIGT